MNSEFKNSQLIKWEPISVIQGRVLDYGLLAGAIFALFASIIAALLSKEYLFSTNFYFDVFSVVSLFIMFFARKSVPLKLKVLIGIAFTYLIVITSLIQYGTISNQKTLITLIPFLLVLVLDLKKALLAFLGLMISYIFISYLFVSQTLTYQPTTPVNTTPMFWVISGIVTFATGIIVMLLVHNYNLQISKTLSNLEATTAKLELRDIQRKDHLTEKNIMIQEIHHRVKNNLAVVSGLLELQMSAIQNDELHHAMQKSINRIMSIAKVHQLLYQSEDFIRIPFRQYVHDLSDTVIATMNSENKNIQFSNQVEVEYLNVHHGVPLGIIFNELITNSIKYAFATDYNNRISISATTNQNLVNVVYEDNGIGIEDIEEATRSSLGFTLIHSLLSQIDANYDYDTTSGFKLSFSFRSDSNH